MSTTTGKSHPIYIIAAIAIILFSLVGIGAITGLIPNTFSKSQPTDVAPPMPDSAATTKQQAAPAPLAETAPASAESSAPKEQAAAPKSKPTQAVAKKPHTAPKQAAPSSDQMAANAPPAPVPTICRECGVIEAVNAIEQPGEASGLGAVAGGVLGGVLGHQVGAGRGKDVATVAGAIGGAVAGHQIEKVAKKKMQYDVVVRLEDNTAQTVHFQADPGFHVGERVKMVDGQIVRN
jgi:outer membrane lipoprotein SlyB